MKKMIFSLIAAMMLLGTVNSNAQRNVSNDRPRQEIRKEANNRFDRDQPREQVVVADRRVTLVRVVSTRPPTPS